MVEVFRTNVTNPKEAEEIRRFLEKLFVHYKVTFDLEDCDHILRFEGPKVGFEPADVMVAVKFAGYEAEVLEEEIMTSDTLLRMAICGH